MQTAALATSPHRGAGLADSRSEGGDRLRARYRVRMDAQCGAALTVGSVVHRAGIAALPSSLGPLRQYLASDPWTPKKTRGGTGELPPMPELPRRRSS